MGRGGLGKLLLGFLFFVESQIPQTYQVVGVCHTGLRRLLPAERGEKVGCGSGLQLLGPILDQLAEYFGAFCSCPGLRSDNACPYRWAPLPKPPRPPERPRPPDAVIAWFQECLAFSKSPSPSRAIPVQYETSASRPRAPLLSEGRVSGISWAAGKSARAPLNLPSVTYWRPRPSSSFESPFQGLPLLFVLPPSVVGLVSSYA
jgi:hypothetical protein